MENDSRRRQANEDRPQRYQPHNEERGRDRESWRPDNERTQRRADSEESGWLDYDRNSGRSEQRDSDRAGSDEQRYGPRGAERSNFSPDWSRESAKPRQSDDPYYSRNRDRGDDDSRSRSRESYGRDWPYDRGGQGRDVQRSRDDEQDSHYRGYYSRSATPFEYPGGQGYLYSESITLHGPYTGRGPKGYRRSDQQLIEEASQRLERDGHIDATDIEVTAENGIITLRGTVPDRRTKRLAEECVESVYGTRDVMNELRVLSQSEPSQSSRASQEAQGSQGLQGSQRTQSGRGAQQASQSSQPSSGEDKKPPKH